MNKFLCLSILALLTFKVALFGQGIVVTGTVTSSEDGSALPGVNILVQGTTTGTTTNMVGKYSITVPDENSSLVFSFVGLLTETVKVGSQKQINVNMVADVTGLKEVVVTALGIAKEKKTLGYSVSDISGNQVNEARETNVINSLSGKVAGLFINQNSGGPDASNRVVLRGNTSISGNNEVLYVVDGIPLFNTANTTISNQQGSDEWGNGYDLGKTVSDINPDDIATISVLKGPNAAALYGSRAANGVILITTKKGTAGGMGISFSSNYVWEKVSVVPDFQNIYGQGLNGVVDTTGAAARQHQSWGAKMQGQNVIAWNDSIRPYSPQENNFKDFFNTGSSWTNSLALNGGNEKSTYYVSYTNLSYKGIVPNNNMYRNSITLRGTAKLGERLSADTKFTYNNQLVNNRPSTSGWGDNVALNLMQMPRNANLDDMKNYETADGKVNNPFAGYGDNPYYTVNKVQTKDSKDHLLSFLSLTYEFTNWIKLQGRAGTDLSYQHFQYFAPQNHPFILGGQFSESEFKNQESNYDVLLMINHSIISDIDFSLNMGGNLRSNSTRVMQYQGNNLTVDGIENILNTGAPKPYGPVGTTKKQVNSVYANGQFGFYKFAYLDWTLRNDWSSTLPKNNWSYFYPSASLSVLLSEKIKIAGIDYWKLRGSLAQVGNDTDPYNLLVSYIVNPIYRTYPEFTMPTTQPFAELKPEITTASEIGTDIRGLNNRIDLDFTYYNKVTKNQILPLPVAPESGYSYKILNAGKIKNSGIEIMFDVKIINSSNFKWDVALNWSKNKSKVLELAPDQGLTEIPLANIKGNVPFNIKAVTGGSYGEIWGYGYARDSASGKIIVDAAGLPMATNQQIKLGDINPRWMGGLTSNFSYKNFSLSFLIDMRKGGKILSLTDFYLDQSGNSKRTIDNRETGFIVPNSVNQDGTANTTSVTAQQYFSNSAGSVTTKTIIEDYVYSADYVKFKELTVSYRLPVSIISKLKLKEVTVGVVGRNLFFFSRKTTNFDPEVSGYSTRNAQGVEYYSLPSTRTYGVNLAVKF